MYFDSHAHYDHDRFDGDREELLGRILPEAGIDYVVNIGSDMPSSQETLALTEQYGYFYGAVGIHPHEAKTFTKTNLEILANYTKNRKILAIGEIGLDYYYDHSPRDVQMTAFKEQLQLCLDLKMPVIIHCRDAAQDCFDILKASGIGNLYGGEIHCYSGSKEMAAEYVKMGFFLGIGGVVTFKKAREIKEVVASIPIERLLVETDCPYLSPEPNRGHRNDSQNLDHICREIGSIKQISQERVAELTKRNALELFSLK